MTITINPGSGPVDNTTQENADANMEVFRQDVKERHGYSVVSFLFEATQEDGRYRYLLTCDGAIHEVEMPGWPLEQVRYMDQETQNIWDFPRLYVNGDSGVWEFARNYCRPDEDD